MAANITAGSPLSCWSTAWGKSKQSIIRNKRGCALEVANMAAQDFTRHPVERKPRKPKVKIAKGERKHEQTFLPDSISAGNYSNQIVAFPCIPLNNPRDGERPFVQWTKNESCELWTEARYVKEEYTQGNNANVCHFCTLYLLFGMIISNVNYSAFWFSSKAVT